MKKIIAIVISVVALMIIFNTRSKREAGGIVEILTVSNLIEQYGNEYLYFGSSNCKICKQLKGEIENISIKYKKKIYYIDIENFINEEEFQKIREQLVLYSVPTIYKLEEGIKKNKVVVSKVNEQSIKKIIELLEDN